MAVSPPLRFRAMDVSDLLDETFAVYRARFALFAGLSVLLTIPTILVSYLSGQFDQLGFFLGLISNASRASTAIPPSGNPLVSLLIYPVTLALLPFTIGALVLAAADVVLGRPASLGRALRGVLNRYWHLLGFGVLYSLLGLTLLIPPLFAWLAVRLAVAVPAMIIEGRGPIAGIERSWRLVEGRWWRTFLVVLLLWLIQQACSWGLVPLFGLLAALLPGLGDSARGGLVLVGVQLAAALVTPIPLIGSVLLYLDFRVRRESIDLDQMAVRAAQAATA